MAIRFQLNGAPYEVTNETTLELLIENLGFKNHALAIEINQELVPKEQRKNRIIIENDRIEIVSFVGGG